MSSSQHTKDESMSPSTNEEETERSIRLKKSVVSSSAVYRVKGRETAIGQAFDDLDIKKNGLIDREEATAFMEEAVKYVGLKTESEVVEAAVDALIYDAGGGDENDCITRSQFFNIFERHPDLLTVFQDEETSSSVRESIRNRVVSKVELNEETVDNEQVWAHAHTEWKNRGVALVWLSLYIAANIIAFTYKGIKYARRDEAMELFGNCIIVARGAAQTLNFNACVVLLPICRHLLTHMRSTWVRFLFPFDAALEFHMLVGIMIGLFSTAHVSAHICDWTRFANADEEEIIALFGDKLGDIPQSKAGRWKLLFENRAGYTGLIMVFCLAFAYSTILTRRKHFNLFWYSHHLLVVFLAALCFHGTGNLLEPFQSVYWIMGPLFCYLAPRFYRETKCSEVKIIDVQIKIGDVIALRLQKPSTWEGRVQAGMYAFLNIPAISRSEWHPFTLTSAPIDDYIEFHFRPVGDWTKKVHDHFDNVQSEALAGVEEGQDRPVPRAMNSQTVVKVDGPIGASSQGFSDYPVIVLVGAGIGVTPMISVLKMLLANPGKMRRTFFYWTVRDRDSFAWFTSLMDAVYESDQKHVLQVRHFLTSVKDDDRDLGAVLLHHATRAMHKRTDIDLLLGNQTHHQVEVGRPNWDEELQSVQDEAKRLGFNECGIFLCGPDKMADALRETSTKLSREDKDFHMYFTKETF